MLYLNSKGVIDVGYKEEKFDNKELEFAIFCIENVADKLNIDATKVSFLSMKFYTCRIKIILLMI